MFFSILVSYQWSWNIAKLLWLTKLFLKKKSKNHSIYQGKDLLVLHFMLKKIIKYSDNAEEHVLELLSGCLTKEPQSLSIGGLAWSSKPHVPWNEWLLVTNKSSFGNPRLSTLMSQDPNQSKPRDVQIMYFLLVLFACRWLSSHFCFLCKTLRQWMNSCCLVLGDKVSYHDAYNETAKSCKPTVFVLNLRFLSIC